MTDITACPQPGVHRVLCLGVGRMAQGIALHYACRGTPVVLLDCRERTPAAFASRQATAWQELQEGWDLIARIGLRAESPALADLVTIRPLSDPALTFTAQDLVYECVPEEIAIKHETLRAISRRCDGASIIASTTSTIMVDDLSAAVVNPERFINAHWLNPAYIIPLVELSPGTRTDPAVTATLASHLRNVGKQTVTCRPSPGFIVPRLQALVMNEAARMVEEGVASAADIDRAVHYGFGFRFAEIGLLEFIDWGGCDILFHASAYLEHALHDPKFAAPPIIKENMAHHRRGLRDGTGFYNHTGRDTQAWREAVLRRLAARLKDMP
ncbi:3-hydroxyacyl-CoA dehydrogenase NAD-binding domain-containing protein [Komagataeibacter xylinus]|uniref:L-gulonate 3-dehydrogenase n=1 Tax=Komagataeibacter xylinus TaxID=28448 RepID=A0A857FNX3_KOMXY|nr:3-hydroxyacyl-CoA dehydrogenase NAD-binding domain-containing protein [Komagataeibacter xylinus]QHC36001.1 3-hydroxyacyl-CoA dehydrogenase [Komagataeibacter xylinus]